MIVCHKVHFAATCHSRGYILEDALACVVSRDGDFLTVDETHAAYPKAKAGLGDMVAAGLSSIGITKERVSEAIGRPCGCGERQATLNSLGAKYLGLPEGSTAQNTDSPTSDSP
jgi:hypothetical protein